MTSTEQKIFNIVNRSRNKTARVPYIARYSGMSSNYVNLVCQGLCRRGHITFTRGLAAIQTSMDFGAEPQAPVEPQVAASISSEGIQAMQEEAIQENVPQVALVASFVGLSKDLVAALDNAGYRTAADLAEAPIAKLMQASGMDVKQAADLINKARGELGTVV